MARAREELARRLRALRVAAPDVPQATLAAVLGVSVASISADENQARGIPDDRLSGYATFYAVPRLRDRLNLAKDAKLTPKELADRNALLDGLTPSERSERDRLLSELKELRDEVGPEAPPALADVAPQPRRTWAFEDGAPVWVICGEIPPGEQRSSLAEPVENNYTELFSYADVDALVELFGHIRVENPASEVRFLKSNDIESDNLSGHLVLLGGLGWNQAAEWFAWQSQLPVRQVEHPDYLEGEVFEVTRDGVGRQYVPRHSQDPELGLVEDLGLLVRMRSPYNRARTLTICNGIYSRGVLGAVRCLSDTNLRASNEQYILERFGEDAEEFLVLMKVRVLKGRAVTPDLTIPDVVIYTWPERT
jgi:hypothetical protein